MTKSITFLAFILITGSICTAQSESLIKDSNLNQWQNIYPHGEAKIIDNELHLISPKQWFFITNKKYKDFFFEAEIKMPEVKEYSNSGFIFRAQTRKNKNGTEEVFGYQAEVDPTGRKWSGGLYDQGRRGWLNPLHKKRSHPDEDFKENLSPEWSEEKSNTYKHLEWNKYRIECKGSELKISVNGILTTHVIDTKDTEGYIGIQHHGSKAFGKTQDLTNTIKFRNLTITEIALDQ